MTNPRTEAVAKAIQRSDIPNERNEYVIETDWELNGHKYIRCAQAAEKALIEALMEPSGPLSKIREELRSKFFFGVHYKNAELAADAAVELIREMLKAAGEGQ